MVYTSPEIILKLFDQKNDMYAMGKVIAEIFGANPIDNTQQYQHFFNKKPLTPTDIIEINAIENYTNLFNNSKLTQSEKNNIEKGIKKMLCFGAKRFDIDHAIQYFEKITFEYLIAHSDPKKKHAIRNANRKTISICANEDKPTIQVILDKLAEISNLDEAISEFKRLLQVKVLSQCKTKKSIIDCLQRLEESYKVTKLCLINLAANLIEIKKNTDRAANAIIDTLIKKLQSMQKIDFLNGDPDQTHEYVSKVQKKIILLLETAYVSTSIGGGSFNKILDIFLKFPLDYTNLACIAIYQEDTAILKKLLHSKAVSLKSKTKDGVSLAFLAAKEGHIESLKLLKKYGADINQAAQQACRKKDIAALTTLIKSNLFDVNQLLCKQLERNDLFAIQALISGGDIDPNWRNAKKRNLIYIAALNDKEEFFKYCVTRKDFDLNLSTGIPPMSPIWVALKNNKMLAFYTLTNLGVDLLQKDASGLTLIEYAEKTNNKEALDILHALEVNISPRRSVIY